VLDIAKSAINSGLFYFKIENEEITLFVALNAKLDSNFPQCDIYVVKQETAILKRVAFCLSR